MNKIFKRIRAVVSALAAPAAPADPFAGMSQRELADLPTVHPLRD
jgi:hypothetical protein